MNQERTEIESKKPNNKPATSRPNKSVSLPKIQSPNKTHESIKNEKSKSKKVVNILPISHIQKKPLMEYHRINWSIGPKCLVKGHEGLPVIYVCVQPNCEEITRLVCEQCFYHQHKHHNKSCLAIDEIKNGKITELRYWPFDPNFKNIYDFIKKHLSYVEGLIHDVRSSFQNLRKSILAALEETENIFVDKIQKFYSSKQTPKSQFINHLIDSMNSCFQMASIQNSVKEIFTKEIRHDVFIEKMNRLLRSSRIQENRNKLKEYFQSPQTNKGTDMEFDKIYFKKKQKIIISDISDQQKALQENSVVVDQAAVGLEQIIVQSISYLNQASLPVMSRGNPLTFQRKKFDDGTLYHGFISNGKRVLLGTRDYKNGYIYYGEWKANCRNGWGVYENKQLTYKYAGFWKQDKKNGYGKQETQTYTYEGDFLNDRREGFGTVIEDKVRYDITWKNDKKDGKGKKITEKGESQVYFLNGIESKMRGSKPNPGQNSHKDVTYLAKMFGNKETIENEKEKESKDIDKK